MCADVRQHDQIPKNKKTLRNTVIPAAPISDNATSCSPSLTPTNCCFLAAHASVPSPHDAVANAPARTANQTKFTIKRQPDAVV